MATETWEIDLTHSSVGFSVRHMVVSKVHGRFKQWGGTLYLDPADLAASKVEATIDAASIDTHDEKRDGHLRSPDFLDAEKFPKFTFKSKSIEQRGKDAYRMIGDLTIRDVTKEVALDVEYGGRAKDPWGNERVGFTAHTKFDRKDFGLIWNAPLETGGVLVGEMLDVTIDVEAVKKS